MLFIQSIFGILVLVGFCWLISEKRKQVDYQDILIGLVLQFLTLILILKVPPVRELFSFLNRAVLLLESATKAGTTFVFGYLGGGALPFREMTPGASFIFALQAMPIVLVVSALSSLFFYWRILPVLVKACSWVLEKTMRIGGAVGLSGAANIFLGMVEAPLFVRPYLKHMTRSELFSVMSCGMAGIAGTVMVLYASLLRNIFPDALTHIIAVSFITVPGAIMISRIMIPETEPTTAGEITPPQEAKSSMDAVTIGTVEGINLLINIIAMIIVLIALVYIVNGILSWLPQIGSRPITLQLLLGYMMAPIVWLIGIPWSEAMTAGSLMGTKTVLNELIAFVDFANLPPDALGPRSKLIMIYALCGFANFGSLGIMIGGLGVMAPERRREILGLGMKSLISGTVATLMAGAIVGIITV